jgi:thioredoxin 1
MPTPALATASPDPVLDVVCLCAAWCGTCGEYELAFAELQRSAPGHRYRWIDIEDEADLVGDIDVETFPTLLIAVRGRVLFAGPVLPRLGDAQRLLAVQAERVQTWVAAGEAVPQPALGLAPDQAEAYIALAVALHPAP